MLEKPASDDILLYEVDEKIATITFNRPRALNALSWPLLEQLEKRLREAEKDPAVSVIIIRGQGSGFSAGYDFGESDPESIGPGSGPADGHHEPRGVSDYGRGVWNSRAHVQGHIHYDQLIWGLWKPVIAQVHGFALAGACTLAVACDLTVIADDAKIGMPPARWLATGDNMGLISLMCGMKKAREMSYGKILNGVEAVAYGLATSHFPSSLLDAETRKIARQIAHIEPELLMLNKMGVNRVWDIVGARSAMEIGGEFDSLCHMANTGRPLKEAIKSQGSLGGALEFLNRPWGGL